MEKDEDGGESQYHVEGWIKILVRVEFGFHTKEFFIPIPVLKNNPNTSMNENRIDFPFPLSILMFQMWSYGR